MDNPLPELNKQKNLSNIKENKQYDKQKNNNSQTQKTFTQKKLYQKSLYNIFKNDSKIKPLQNFDNESKSNLKLDTKLFSSLFNFNFENSLQPPNLNNETILNFRNFSNFSLYPNENSQNNNIKKNEYFSPLVQYGVKYIMNDIHKSLYDNINSIIKIQSCLRGYLVKKNLIINNFDKSYFEKNSINGFIKIQKHIRGFLLRKNIRKKILIKIINQKRKISINLIIKKLKIYLNVIKIKKIVFINHNLKERNQKAIYIQETFKNYKFYKSFKKLKKEIDKSYFLYYPYKTKKVEIIIYLNDDINNRKENKKYTFTYNKLLKYFILLINPNIIFSGKYKCQFVSNDIIICDQRYPIIQHDNDFFNIIDLIQNKNLKNKINQKKKIKKIKKVNKIYNNNKNGLYFNDNNGICCGKNLNNSSKLKIDNRKLSLENIIEEDDEGKSVTSKDNRNELRLREQSDKSLKLFKNYESEKTLKLEDDNDDNDSFDFTEEEYLEILRNKNNKIENLNYQNLKKGLDDKKPINKMKKIRKASLKKIK